MSALYAEGKGLERSAADGESPVPEGVECGSGILSIAGHE